MKKFIIFLIFISPITSKAVGYKIPEQSVRSVATAGAYMSSANSSDASYFNPANMVFINSSLEVGLRIVNTSNQKFNGNVYIPYVGPKYIEDETRSENFYIPYFHYISPDIRGYKIGLSITTPAGLKKEWKGDIKTFAEEFGLKTMEINPSIAKKINNHLSFAVGIRVLGSKGKVKYTHINNIYKNKITGNSIDYGWNIGITIKPVKNINISANYRSKIDMTLEGKSEGKIGITSFNTDVSVTAPIPTTYDVGISYFLKSLIFEFTYEKIKWSEYTVLDFNYQDATVEGTFGNPIDKNWKDVNCYRVGVQYLLKNWVFMAGYGYNQNPVPEKTYNFDLPDGDSNVYSLGLIRKSGSVEVGLGLLYASKKKREIKSNRNGITGKFKDNNIKMAVLSLGYKF